MKGITRNKRNRRNKRNTRKKTLKHGGYAYVTPKYSADVVTPSGTKHKKGDKKKKKQNK
jgi:hypothetical protein